MDYLQQLTKAFKRYQRAPKIPLTLTATVAAAAAGGTPSPIGTPFELSGDQGPVGKVTA